MSSVGWSNAWCQSFWVWGESGGGCSSSPGKILVSLAYISGLNIIASSRKLGGNQNLFLYLQYIIFCSGAQIFQKKTSIFLAPRNWRVSKYGISNISFILCGLSVWFMFFSLKKSFYLTPVGFLHNFTFLHSIM